MKQICSFSIVIVTLLNALTSCAQDGSDTTYMRRADTLDFVVHFQPIGIGVEYCETDAPYRSILGDSKFTILKLNPDLIDAELFTSSNGDKIPKPVNEWADSLGVNIVFNAGMYDLSKPLISRGLLKNGNYYNQPLQHPTFNSIIALNPTDKSNKEFEIFDLEQTNCNSLKEKFGALIQGLRMLDGNGNPMNWKKRVQSCSMLLAAEDDKKNIYLIFTRSPYVHNTMIGFLKKFPIPLKNAIYLEGGPETSLYVSIGNVCIQKVGSYVSNTYPTDKNERFWPLPNVIGIKVKPLVQKLN